MRALSELSAEDFQALVKRIKSQTTSKFNPSHYRAGDRFKINESRKEGEVTIYCPYYLYYVDATPNVLTFQNAERAIFTIQAEDFMKNLECGRWILNNSHLNQHDSANQHRDHRLGF